MSELDDLRKIEHQLKDNISTLESKLDWQRDCLEVVDEAIQRKLMDSLDQKGEVE